MFRPRPAAPHRRRSPAGGASRADRGQLLPASLAPSSDPAACAASSEEVHAVVGVGRVRHRRAGRRQGEVPPRTTEARGRASGETPSIPSDAVGWRGSMRLPRSSRRSPSVTNVRIESGVASLAASAASTGRADRAEPTTPTTSVPFVERSVVTGPLNCSNGGVVRDEVDLLPTAPEGPLHLVGEVQAVVVVRVEDGERGARRCRSWRWSVPLPRAPRSRSSARRSPRRGAWSGRAPWPSASR